MWFIKHHFSTWDDYPHQWTNKTCVVPAFLHQPLCGKMADVGLELTLIEVTTMGCSSVLPWDCVPRLGFQPRMIALHSGGWSNAKGPHRFLHPAFLLSDSRNWQK